MCGFVGVLSPFGVRESDLRRMAAAVRHRGPDDEGVWIDSDAGVGLGHTRLSILDLSMAGHQPMVSASGRYVFAFNGEIYNHVALRAELERDGLAPAWRGHSDTESLLAGFDVWGIEATVVRSVGMFAFAVWDRSSHILILGRDRIGEKPLYFGWAGEVLLFGSELKALRGHPAFRAEIDRGALTLLMRHGYIPAPHSIYQGVHKQLPGTLLTLAPGQREPNILRYWDPRAIIEEGIAHPFAGTPDEAVDAVERQVGEAVRGQMVADVPLGAFLSGGVDSSTVVALMQAHAGRRVRTFTIGFHEVDYNEADHAKAVARHLGTDHTELYVSPRETLDVIPRLPSLFCEPFADSSQIPTFLISQLARRDVTVSLSGDGGDELFGGYNRYVLGQRIWGRVQRVPRPIRVAAARLIRAVPPNAWTHMLHPLQRVLPSGLAQAHPGEKIIKAAAVLGARNSTELYRLLVSHWATSSDMVIDGQEPTTLLDDPTGQPRTDQFVHDMMALDLLTYLPDDILVKVDRAAMGVSLETRVPLLDHRVVELAWRLPLAYKLRNGEGKWPLRQVLYRHVPAELFERPKMGFGVPIDSWLRGPLREWAEELLSEDRLRREGFFHPAPIRQEWSEHLSGRHNWQHHLWDILMFQAWLQETR